MSLTTDSPPPARADGLITESDSSRGRLLFAASRLFGERGFAGTTVRDLAAEVGILSGSIFHHFRSKEEILCEVMCVVIDSALVRFEEELARASSLEDELHTLIRLELDAMHDTSGAGFSILGSEWRHLGPDSQRRVLALRDRYNELWTARLHQARAAGLHDTDPGLMRNFLRGAVVDSATWFRTTGPLSLDDLEAEIYRAFFSNS